MSKKGQGSSLRFQALSQFTPETKGKSVSDFIQQDGYRKSMRVNFSFGGSKILHAEIPDESTWDRLAEHATVGIESRFSDDKTLELSLDVQVTENRVPQSTEEWEEIITLQYKSEEGRWGSRNEITFWPKPWTS